VGECGREGEELVVFVGGFKRIRRRMLRCPRLGTNELKFRIIMTKKIIEKIIAIIISGGRGGENQ